MAFLEKLFGRSAPSDVLWLYVRCNKCGAKVRVRVNLHNDPSLADDGGYILRKEILDDTCFQLMRAELHFDGQRRETSRQIEGGQFITHEDYEATAE